MFLLLYLVMFILHNLFIEIKSLPSCKISLNNFNSPATNKKKLQSKFLNSDFYFFSIAFLKLVKLKHQSHRRFQVILVNFTEN